MKKSITELRSQRVQAVDEARTFLDEHRQDNGLMSAADVKEYEKLEGRIIALGDEISRMEKLDNINEQLSRPTSQPVLLNPSTGRYSTQSITASDRYAAEMDAAIRSNFQRIGNTMTEGRDAAGGYLVPDSYSKKLVEALDENCFMRKLCTVLKISGQHKINIAATKPAAAWIDEGEALQFSDATFDQLVLEAHKLHVAVKVSEELLQDSAFDLESFIARAFAQALANAEEDAFLNGDGKNKPTGIFDAEKGGEIGVVAASTSITADEIIDLVYSLKRPYRKNAVFIMNDQTLAEITKLKDTTGQYLWQPSLQAGEPDRILGFPVYTSAFAPTAEPGKPVIAFGDLSFYQLAENGSRKLSRLNELYAEHGEYAFVIKERIDAGLSLREAVKIMTVAEANG